MIGILFICTGKYCVFWKDFYESSERFFLPSQQKRYFVFTDADEIYEEGNPNVKKIHQEFLGWPGDTLMRFQMFSEAASELKSCEYLFFLNANKGFIEVVNNDILPDDNHDGLVAVLHPYFWNHNAYSFSYDKNMNSTAYIPYGLGKHYFMGGFNVGKPVFILN